MWREKIQTWTKEAIFKNAANKMAVAQIEKGLKIVLPGELRDLLLESDGIQGRHGTGLIWNCERIAADNLKYRSYPDFRDLYMPFDSLLFFADAGNGDQFAFAIRNNQIQSPNIYVWNHENDSRTWVAPSLEKYLEWWLSGKIKV
ncbi:MAG TPA: SMI1/KNR4 family protein [Verrucomicrobiae bacterium]|jgi:hypothetical protein